MKKQFLFHIFVSIVFMRNSTIKQRTGVCPLCSGNNKVPLIKGLCNNHYWQSIRMKSVQKQEAKEPVKILHPKANAELNRWFQERRKEMKGVCAHCGNKSCRDSDQYYKFSIAHLLPKRLFKSVATHPLNWIELCFWAPSCHTNFDNNTLDITELNCYDLVIERFIAIYPEIDKKERKYIPETLLQYINIDI